ncbi:endonuclease/exonuclease/phosphatase family protein [Mycolicibacterium grossiae]|nr:endonuclease/exonuclease/phosphatase family protein [Mycolicibacterium grossiae]
MTRADGTTRFLTWNIQSGGGNRVPQIMREVDLLAPDVVGFTEVKSNNLATLSRTLEASGFDYIETPSGEDVNSVLLASKKPFEAVKEEITHDQERWASVRIPSMDLRVLCVHIPGSPDHKFDSEGRGMSGQKRKELLWYEVIRYATIHKDERVAIMGDLNTGLNEIDRTPRGTPFKLSENIRVLRMDGRFTDTWRYLNPKNRDYTWFTTRDGRDFNGFRLDYIWVSAPLRESIRSAQHLHHVRGKVSDGKLSDHAIVVADIAL